MFKDIWKNKNIIYRMSLIDMRSMFKASILSYFWIAINPLLMIGVYLFSFYAAGDSIEYIQLPVYHADQIVSYTDNFQQFSKIGWLIIGVLTWTYVGGVIISGSNATRNYSWMVSKIGTPLSTPPMLVTLSKSYVGIITIIVSWFIYMIIAGVTHDGKVIDYNILQLPLMIILLFAFLCLWSLIFSPLTAFSKDIFNVVSILPVFLQWITGVFLPLSKANMNEPIGIIFRINPFNFLIDNIRGSIMGNSYFWNDWVSLVSFLGFFFVLLVVAIIINKRAKRVVVDLI